jgi:molybdate transport system substrate-binding protein
MVIAVFSTGNLARAETVRVAIASNFTAPMKKIVFQFENDTHHRVQLVSGSSGKFFAQISQAAPFDVFLSADQNKPYRLEQAGFTEPGTRFTYALGGLVLWTEKNTPIELDEKSLHSGTFSKLAMANPKLAPYGLAAKQVLDRLDLWKSLNKKIVMGQNINQTFQFVDSANAELGFIALSQVFQNGVITRGSGWIIPAQFYDPIKQDAVLLSRARQNPAAWALLDYLKSKKAGSIMNYFGYKLPESGP